MGYYSRFEFDITNCSEDEKLKIISDFKEQNKDFNYAINKDGSCKEESKWYEFEEDMKELSKIHPELVLLIKREGEITFDIDITYFKNGKMQKCPAIISFDKFDESKLE